jgi:DNA repair protein RecN (Recombination protein N)
MLAELYVRNLAVIEELRLEFGPGLTVLTGDEGVGKSLVVDALGLLLGGRASGSLIRSGASAATVEAVFWTQPVQSQLAAILQEAGLEPEADGRLILTREVQEQGRSVARVNGRSVAVSLLRQLGECLVDIHAQMEHLSLLSPQRQMELVDEYGGLSELRQCLSRKVSDLREKGRQLSFLCGEGARRQRDLLEYQVAEIERANPQVGEDEALERECQILQRAHMLKEECHAVHQVLYGDERSAAALSHQAISRLRRILTVDPDLRGYLESLESAAVQMEETARDLARYADAVDCSPGRLEFVMERLELLRRLKSKYGPGLPDVFNFAENARKELDALEMEEERRACLEEEYHQLESEAGALAEKLSVARREAARQLAERVNLELADLGMPWARFDVHLRQERSADGLPACGAKYSFTHHGIDRLEFFASTNPGEPMRPLAEITSGGETCRFMLALKCALGKADAVPTLVFDEVDIGVGGRSAASMGKKLASLAGDRQVICITHLPQIACFGDRHYRVTKDISSDRAATRVERLDEESRVEELAAMLGRSGEEAMLNSARALLRSAAGKENQLMVSV